MKLEDCKRDMRVQVKADGITAVIIAVEGDKVLLNHVNDFYVNPDEIREVRECNMKVLRSREGGDHPKSDYWCCIINRANEDIVRLYNSMVDDGVDPEQARMILPQSMMT